MIKTIFKIEKMDCPCEENLIRMKLDGIESIVSQEYNLGNRTLTIIHSGDYKLIENEISKLNLGSYVLESNVTTDEYRSVNEDKKQKKILWMVLFINFAFFLIEMSTGLVSKSMGLVADSLDMLADSFVYALSLFAVGAVVARKKRVALISGYFQIILALMGFVEVIRRFIGVEEMPNFQTMIGVSILALIGNVICLLLLQRTKSNDAHIQASIIFSSNDVIINAGVIIAGLLVWILSDNLPDLIIGSIVFIVVIRGALRILRLAKD